MNAPGPIGGLRRGRAAIEAGYRRLFEGEARVRVGFFDVTHQGGGDWHLFVGRERGECVVGNARLPLRIRTTRWFVRADGAWRHWHHHGSIEAPERLADDQRMMFGHVLGPDA